jgi:hypothetical protein
MGMLEEALARGGSGLGVWPTQRTNSCRGTILPYRLLNTPGGTSTPLGISKLGMMGADNDDRRVFAHAHKSHTDEFDFRTPFAV